MHPNPFGIKQLISPIIKANKSHPPEQILPIIVETIGINLWFFSLITFNKFWAGATYCNVFIPISKIPTIGKSKIFERKNKIIPVSIKHWPKIYRIYFPTCFSATKYKYQTK